MYKQLKTSLRSCTFRHFSRGGYAIFASLHREVRIGVLSVGMLASVIIPKAQAMQVSTSPEANEEADEKELEEISVAGTLSPLTALQAARIVNVITRQQIEASAAQSVNDLLKLAVGVDVRQRGGFGIQTDISINGGTFDQITLLLNGVIISSPQTGHLSADFPVSLSDIERIEVLEGAASRVYGASAFGGAINIVTKEGTITNENHNLYSLEAGAQGGSYATFGGDARVSFSSHSTPSTRAKGAFASSLSSTFLRSSGATLNSDFTRGNIYHSGCYDSKDFRFEWQAGYSRKSYGANTFYSAAYPNQYERNTRYFVSAGAETKGRIRLHPLVYWNRLYDNFELIRGTTTGENFHRSDVHGARVAADVRWKAGRTAIGAEIREEGIYSTALGTPISTIHPIKIPSEDNYYTRHDKRTNLSFNIEHNILLPRFTASFGLLANKNSRFDQHLRFYPGVDLAVTPAAHWRVFASYNKGFRQPTFTDLYYKSPTHEGNQGMQAEESHSFQLGAKANAQWSLFNVQCSIKSFYHRGHNLIDWVMYHPDDVFHSANFNLDNYGMQAQLNVQWSHFNVQCSYAYIHQRRRDDKPVYKSNYAMEYLRHKLVATIDHRIVSRLNASWSLRWQDRVGGYIRYENAQSTGELVNYAPYATLDLKLRWTAKHYELWTEATNLTNRRYFDLGNIPQPGIVVLAGVKVRL